MPEGIGYNPGVKAKTNPTGRGGALGLLSEKLAQGIGNRRRKRRAGQQQQTLSQRSLPQKTNPGQAAAQKSALGAQDNAERMQQGILKASQANIANKRTRRSGSIAETASALK